MVISKLNESTSTFTSPFPQSMSHADWEGFITFRWVWLDLIDVKIEKRNSNNYMLGPTIMSETKFSHVSKHLKEEMFWCNTTFCPKRLQRASSRGRLRRLLVDQISERKMRVRLASRKKSNLRGWGCWVRPYSPIFCSSLHPSLISHEYIPLSYCTSFLVFWFQVESAAGLTWISSRDCPVDTMRPTSHRG